MTVEIVAGRVRVSEVHHVIDHPNVKVFEVDLDSKYPSDITCATTDDTISVLILDDERTLRVNEDTIESTEVRFSLSDAPRWFMVADGARYTVRICLYRHD